MIVSDSRSKGMVSWSMFWLVFFGVRTFIVPYRLTRKWVSEEIVNDDSSTCITDESVILEVVRTIRRCKRLVPATCLTQALATKAVLKRYGQESKIVLGVAKSDASILAHAWVEIDGRIIFGRLPNNSSYSLLHPPSWS
jgi:hypothetical protein